MDQRLIILRPETRVNGLGERVCVWEESRPVWAEREKMTGRAAVEVQEHFPDYSVTFNVRSAHHIEENWRVRHVGGHLYTVTNIIPNRRRGMQSLQCERVNE